MHLRSCQRSLVHDGVVMARPCGGGGYFLFRTGVHIYLNVFFYPNRCAYPEAKNTPTQRRTRVSYPHTIYIWPRHPPPLPFSFPVTARQETYRGGRGEEGGKGREPPRPSRLWIHPPPDDDPVANRSCRQLPSPCSTRRTDLLLLLGSLSWSDWPDMRDEARSRGGRLADC